MGRIGCGVTKGYYDKYEFSLWIVKSIIERVQPKLSYTSLLYDGAGVNGRKKIPMFIWKTTDFFLIPPFFQEQQ